jgi:hypothetical protein
VQQRAGLKAAQELNVAVQEGDVFFHRVLFPSNAEFEEPGTASGYDDAFKFDQFPNIENTTSGDPLLDMQGLPITFANLRLIVLDIRPIRPFYQSAATSILTSTNVNVANNQTVLIDAKTYTFKTALTPTEGEVLIGADADASLLNLIRAINHTGTPGTDYSAAAAHPTVSAAAAVTAHSFTVTALTIGVAGNSIATATSSTELAWTGLTLGGGSDIADPPVARPLEGAVNVKLEGDIFPAVDTSATVQFSTDTAQMLTFGGEAWVPGAGGSLQVHFAPTLGGAVLADVNAEGFVASGHA